MPRGRKKRIEDCCEVQNTECQATVEELQQEPQKTAEELHVEQAEKVLLQDPQLQKIAALLRESAAAGNPAARTLYGVYHTFIGANIPKYRDESYAEAIKQFYLNRMGGLECQLLVNLITNTTPGATLTAPGSLQPPIIPGTQLKRNAFGMLQPIEGNDTISKIPRSLAAQIVSIPVSYLVNNKKTLKELFDHGIYSLGQYILQRNDVVYRIDETTFDMLDNIIKHFSKYVDFNSDEIITIIKDINHSLGQIPCHTPLV